MILLTLALVTCLPPAASHGHFAPGAGRYGWPLSGTPTVVRRFDPPPEPWLAGHRGVDLAGEPGAPVHASGAGVVVFAGMLAGRPVVSVAHDGGLRTTYEPVQPAVLVGQRVERGALLGTLADGHTGCPGACLHWGLRSGSSYLDPLSLVGLGRVRLLPL
jgi:murein DD-endopeptidase MepM/ murein hydrolase activator NlpD